METKHGISVMLAVLFVVSSMGHVMADGGDTGGLESRQITFHFSSPALEREGEYLKLFMDETTGYHVQPGAPLLPVRTTMQTLPFGTRIKDVHVETSSIKTMSLSSKLCPSPQPTRLNGQQPTAPAEGSIYTSDSPYPSSWATWDTRAGLQDGRHVLSLSVSAFPARYIPADDTLQYADTVTVEIRLDQPRPAPLPAANDAYDLLVITPETFSQPLERLVSHKESRNVDSKLVTLDDIKNGVYFTPEGRDEQERIKYFIRDAIENWGVTYVMLVGGADEFPVRETHVEVGDSDDEIFPSDLYYADVYNGTGGFASWDTNENNVFGEYNWNGNTDIVDLYPDVYLGRLACTSTGEVTTSVDKIIAYETSESSSQPWFTNLVVVGGDSFTDAYGETSGVNEGELINSEIIDIMDTFRPERIWESNGKVYEKQNIKDAIENGAGFVEFSGHGNPELWATHPHNGSKYSWIPRPNGYKTSDVDSLSNSDMLPVVVTGACSTAKYTDDDNCFGWSFISNPDGGGIATLGCSGLGYVYTGKYITYGLVGKMEIESFRSFQDRGADTFGELWGTTIESYLGGGMDAADYKTIEEWQAFGDPSLSIAYTPAENNPPHTPSAPTGPADGKRWREYTYNASTTDPDGDSVSYMFDWGDGSTSEWLGPHEPGETVSAEHRWMRRGSYEIKVKARDSKGAESEWSDPMPVTMPLTGTGMPLLETLLEALFTFFHLLP